MERRGMQRGGPRGRAPSRGGQRGRGGPPGAPSGRGGPGMRGRGGFSERGNTGLLSRGGGPPSRGSGPPRGSPSGPPQKRGSPVPRGHGAPTHRGSRRDSMGNGSQSFRGPSGRGGPGMRGRGGAYSDRGSGMNRGGYLERGSYSERGSSMNRGGISRQMGSPMGSRPSPFESSSGPDRRAPLMEQPDMMRRPGGQSMGGYGDMMNDSYPERDRDMGFPDSMGPSPKRGRWASPYPQDRLPASEDSYYSHPQESIQSRYPREEPREERRSFVQSSFQEEDYDRGSGMRGYPHQSSGQYEQPSMRQQGQYSPVGGGDYRNGGSRHEERGAPEYLLPSYNSTGSGGGGRAAYDEEPMYRRSAPAQDSFNPSSYDAYDDFPTPSASSYGTRDYGPPSGSRGNIDDPYGYESYGGASSYQSHDNYGGSMGSSYGPPQRGPPSITRHY